MEVNFDGADRQSKLLGDHLIGCAVANHLRNLRLSCRETMMILGGRFGSVVTRQGRIIVRCDLLQDSTQLILQVLLDRDRSRPVDCRRDFGGAFFLGQYKKPGLVVELDRLSPCHGAIVEHGACTLWRCQDAARCASFLALILIAWCLGTSARFLRGLMSAVAASRALVRPAHPIVPRCK